MTGTDAGNGLQYQVGYSPATVTATVTAANPPRAYTIGSAGSLHVNASTATVARRITLAGAPNAVAVSPDGSTAYVTGAKTTKLYVIGTATGHVQATVPVGRGAMGVAVS